MTKIKMNSLNPFDKKFFGRSLRNRINLPISNPTKLKQDSADDFNKYMFQQMLNNLAFIGKK